MAKVRKVGRPKKYTAKGFQKACEDYFASISYEEPVKKPEMITEDGVAVLDDKGHVMYRYVPVITADGKEAVQTCWTEAPSLAALCLYLGIDRATFCRYGEPDPNDPDDPDSETFCNTVSRARGRVEAYLVQRLEDKNASRGAIFNLQQNFGWKERREIAMDKPTRDAVSLGQGMTMAQKIEALKAAGVDVGEWE